MPGILPMKVIKVGTSSQSRIAQACDRCRSKKIRCGGERPTCSQCANVGFECRTSDKLSRRAFPRGYTESLEERVRALEAEVRELKDLLDEKDEKIDMLSKMHGNRRPSITSVHKTPSPDLRKDATPLPKEDCFKVHASPLLLGVENSDSYFMGPSSGRAFIEAFKRNIQESGKPCAEFNPEAFLHMQGCYPLTPKSPSHAMRIPPRLFSDRCVNIYFQEWAPLFPVIHKPTFLRLYEEFVADPEKIKNNHKLAQLYLVFSIAALSSEQPDVDQIAACEVQWQRAIEAIIMDNTMNTLQCLVLALMYCTIRADYKRLQHYKSVAVGLSLRLGLHQSQKRFSFGALTIETRKKVFWTLYTLDCFSAAVLGLPKLLKESDIHAEYPSDTDDEYVTEKGFQPSLPGEHTRLSSALALFRAARILAKVLEKNYPAAATVELSLHHMSALEVELDAWSDNLPQHLKLTFRQDKPSTDITGSRSPLLALAYYYIRVLIYRPAIASTLGPKAAPALISVSESSKHVIQIIQLLEERNMALSFCLNKTDTLVLCSMALLYQGLDLKRDSKLMKDNERLVNAVIKLVDKSKASNSYDLRRVASLLIAVEEPPHVQPAALPTPPRQTPEISMPAPTSRPSPPVGQLEKTQPNLTLSRHASASMGETDLLLQQDKVRRMTMPQLPLNNTRPDLHHARSRPSYDGLRQDHSAQRSENRLSLNQTQTVETAAASRVSPTPSVTARQNLDYLSLSSVRRSQLSSLVQPRRPPQQQQQSRSQMQEERTQQLFSQFHQKGATISTGEWEALLGSIDGGQLNVYDAIYGGPTLALSETASPVVATPTIATNAPTQSAGAVQPTAEWTPDTWDFSAFNLGDLSSAPAQSILSLSSGEDSLSSGEDHAPSEMGLSLGGLEYRNQLLACAGANGQPSSLLDGLDVHYGL